MSINLEGYGLSDDYDNPFKWVFPTYEMQPGELILIWASAKDRKPDPGSLQSGIIRKFYPGIPGTGVSDLTNHLSFPDQPASTTPNSPILLKGSQISLKSPTSALLQECMPAIPW